jgi:hypothetical protein
MRLDAVEMEIPGALSSVVPLEAVFEQERDVRYRALRPVTRNRFKAEEPARVVRAATFRRSGGSI